jgi:hypothetical protein
MWFRITFNFAVDVDPSFHIDADPGATFHFFVDQDLVTRQSDANLRPLVYGPSTAPFWATTVRLLWGHIRPSFVVLDFDPPHLQNFDFDSNPDPKPAFLLCCESVSFFSL